MTEVELKAQSRTRTKELLLGVGTRKKGTKANRHLILKGILNLDQNGGFSY